MKKINANAKTCFAPKRVENSRALFEDVKSLEQMAVDEYVERSLAER